MKGSFRLTGMTCARCAQRIEWTVGRLPGVLSARVNLVTERLDVEYDAARVDEPRLRAAVQRTGFGIANPRLGGESEAPTRLLLLGLVLTVPLVVLSMARDFGLPGFAHDQLWMLVAATIVQFVVGGPFYARAWRSLRARTTNMDVLVVLGSTVAWGSSAGVTLGLFPGPDVYFETGAAIITFVSLGKLLEARARGKASAALEALLDLRPAIARVVRGGAEVEVPVADVAVGDLLAVRPGERVPVDGLIREGRSAFDESMVTGESMPVSKGPGDEVIGATINRHGFVTFEASRVGAETTLARIVRFVEEAQATRAPIQKIADEVGRYFVPVVLAAAFVTLLGWLFVARVDAPSALRNAVAVLIIACPCAIGLATPTALLVGSARGASRGILFRTGEALERAGRATVVILDKTGTLTRGEPALTDVVARRRGGEKDVLWLAASAERGSEHPLGRAVAKAGAERGPSLASPLEFQAVSGEGIRARVEGREVLVGRARWMRAEGIDLEALECEVDRLEGEAKTAMVVATTLVGGPGRPEAVGIVAVADTLKAESREAVDELRRLGLDVVMLTGDNYQTAEAIARQVGITQVRAEVRPEEKADVIRNLKRAARALGTPPPVVVMVGDGVNDAPALAEADVGIALGTGTDVAKEAAGITLISGDLRGVARSIVLSRATLQTIVQNLVWALFYNVALVPIAAYGLLSPMVAAGAMVFSSLFVVTNSLQLRRASVETFVEPKPAWRQGLDLLPRVLAPAGALAALIVVPMLAMAGGPEIQGVLPGTMTPALMMVMAIANGLIAVSYASIPIFLIAFKAKRKDLPFSWVLVLFGAFILACGTTHFVHILGLWWPVGWWQAVVDSICAVSSLATAVVVWPLLPKILALPSPEQMRVVNRALEDEKATLEKTQTELRKAYAEVERRVEERTAELARTNEALLEEIRDRKLAEMRLLEYRKVIECSADMICVLDTSYRYVLANGAFLSYLEVTSESVLGRTVEEVRSRDVFLELKPFIDDCLAGEEVAFEAQLKYPQLGVRDHSVRYSPIVENDHVTGAASIMRDVSEEKRLQGQLLQSQKMEAVGQLAGGVAHDFNNLLSVILGYGHLLGAGLNGDEKRLERLGQMTAAAERAAQLTRSLLAFSRKQVMTPKAVNLNDVVQRVQKLLARIIGEDIRLKSVVNDVDLPVFVDAGQIEQVLVNLATNARDAMPRGGLLAIETGHQTLDERFIAVHGWGTTGHYAVLSVSDSGCGMDEATQKRIFEPFFTTKETGRGTGLGMSIVYGIVKQHQGFLNVYSELGAGSVIRTYLPLIEKGEALPQAAAVPVEVRGGTETILVAEDEASVRTLLSTILSEAGYDVILAEDGQDAVETFAANPDRVGLVLMDMIMPRKSGREAFEEIRRLRPDVRVLFSSGYSPEFLESRGGLGNDLELLMKPVAPDALLRKVRELLDR